MQQTVISYEPMPHQFRALMSQKRVIFLGGGIGCGKTDAGSFWALTRAIQSPKGVAGLIVANTYGQLIDSTIRNFMKNMARIGIAVEPKEPPASARPFTIRIPVGTHWVEVLCRSLDSYHTLAGLEVGWFWADEVYQTSMDAMMLLFGRLRDARMPNQCLLTTTLDDPGTWMHELFVEKVNPEIHDVIYATTLENPHLTTEYIESLKAMYSDQMFRRMCLAQWVSLEGGSIYYAFDRARNVSEAAEFDPHLPILWAHDFNIGVGKPMSSCLAHLRKGKDGIELHVFDEIILDSSDTNDAIREFQGREWSQRSSSGVIVYGDAAGRARDTRSKHTDYTLLAAAGYGNQRVPAANPPIRDRHNTVNALLCNAAGRARLYIHPRCTTLAKGLEVAKLKKGAQYIEDDSVREQHVTTALGYLACRDFEVGR